MELSYEFFVTWMLSHGYLFAFLIMLIGGTAANAAAGFAISLDYFHFWPILFLSIIADFLSDIVQYSIGYWGRSNIVERYGHKAGLSNERIQAMETSLQTHAVKALATMKTMPVIASIALLAAGAIRMPISTFMLTIAAVILPKSIIYIGLGYYFGEAYEVASGHVHKTIVLVIIGVVALFMTGYLWKKTSAFIHALGNNENTN